VLLLAVAAAAAGCRSGRRRPPPLRPERDPIVQLSGDAAQPTRRDLLDAYPLGALPERTDLLASDESRSVFLFQTVSGFGARTRRGHVERILVLSGAGTLYVGERSYPAVEDTSFRIDAGVSRRLVAEPGAPLAAVIVLEPGTGSLTDDAAPE
jgi:hypothetical protein